MNCYYSNLIEGHDTHPIDIECALNGEYSQDADIKNAHAMWRELNPPGKKSAKKE
jgi:hypothetical protein